MSTVIAVIAIGDKKWGEMSLNLALSIKANSPEQKLAIIYEPSSVAGIEPLIDQHFDYGLSVSRYSTSTEFSFCLKTQLYDHLTKMCDATAFVYLDADTIITPGKNPSAWFTEHNGRLFTSYCNDILNYQTGKRRRKDYTFWCDPLAAKEYWNLTGSIPQVNSSFLYFERNDKVRELFNKAKEVYDDTGFEYTEYKSAKPDELCFNIACSHTGLLPHRDTYRPIFFQFGSEIHTRTYIQHYFSAFGFAGTQEPSQYLINAYNETAEHYRYLFAIADEFKLTYVPDLELDYLPIEPVKRGTLYRRGELPNSDGGVFNPSAIQHNGKTLTAYRKEQGISKHMYVGTSAIPHIEYGDWTTELKVDFPANLRMEDFRLFKHSGTIYANHTVCANINTSNIEASCGISVINEEKVAFKGKVELPIETKKVEKNWVFFSEGDKVYCIYSLNPYKLFFSIDHMQTWLPYETKKPELKWIDKSYISNSTNPILIGDSYLVFFHTKSAGEYYHGALLISADTKEITHATRKPIDVKTCGEGLHPKIKYVSGSCLMQDGRIRLYIGEGDSNAVYNDFDANSLIKTIKRYKC